MTMTDKNIAILNSKKGLGALLRQERLDPKKALRNVKYEKRLEKLQEEMLILQQWVAANNKKVVILFEGRDAAGKGGAIRRIIQHLPPRAIRVVALPKPNETELGQWYFQRYINKLPNNGEIVFFDRSWYNRAVVEPVNGFCKQKDYEIFMGQVNEFEKMIQDSGIYLLKLYFSITKKEQERRFKDIIESPIKKWKYSDVDKRALSLWDEYTRYKEAMFEKTQVHAPWKIIKANRKTSARINAFEYILKQIPYEVKDLEIIRHKPMRTIFNE
ncbi:polyphosphate kinase 2 [Psychroserpens sp.]|uniref:polyphosphate kinase 2 n=1 Tax=Psychroserpens sp. TaxID=2020870 RepID=UPI001B119C40|nr:polyphosphate kinase 2 [Psychroserpens sp.]MBO6607432.1 polyphosphate kinase 2 [Psychroserpens sp.]MBO6654490.1 polyphosphate kinase 2 [Psychroserpens sp.]MBO6681161.1 polyphosphate kinase 2 [Psychroserpens sp.]MBO6749882.1 polyphosphate kinase 2 [Psychroserpens sp.]MBO6916130.1 polyphosphate kinase 2 [Psychroserpens sp.]